MLICQPFYRNNRPVKAQIQVGYIYVLCVIDKCVRKSNDVFWKNDIILPIWYRRKRPEFVRINTDPIDYSGRVGPVGRQLSDYSLMQCVLAWKRLLWRWWSSWRRRWDFASLSQGSFYFFHISKGFRCNRNDRESLSSSFDRTSSTRTVWKPLNFTRTTKYEKSRLSDRLT